MVEKKKNNKRRKREGEEKRKRRERNQASMVEPLKKTKVIPFFFSYSSSYFKSISDMHQVIVILERISIIQNFCQKKERWN